MHGHTQGRGCQALERAWHKEERGRKEGKGLLNGRHPG